MTLRYKNNVACTLAASMTDSAVTISLTPGDGAQLPVIASGTDDTFLITATDKNGNKEIISICRRDSGSDTLYVGTGLTHQAAGSTVGRAQEGTTAIAVTYTDDHAISMCPTAGPFEAAVKYSDAGELTVSTAILNYLSTAGITLADLQKLHAITALAANINKDCTGATVQNTRTITAGTGLSGGGTLAADRTISHASHTGDVTGAAALTIAALAVTEGKLAASSVAQAKLKTSSGSVSTISDTLTNLTLPGGEYGFYPQVRRDASFISAATAQICSSFPSASYRTNIAMKTVSTTGSPTNGVAYAWQRYVTSSGEVHWIFLLRDKATKKVLSSWQAPDHPCMGNGGKPLVVAHPFPDFDPGTQEIVVLNPDQAEVNRIVARCAVPGETEPDRDFLDVVSDEYEVDEVSNPVWKELPVTVGLPSGHDWKRFPDGTPVAPIKKRIPKAEMLIYKALKRKG